MKKIFTLFAAVVCGLTMNAKTIYLNTGGASLWNQAGAVFFAHSWDAEDNDALCIVYKHILSYAFLV